MQEMSKVLIFIKKKQRKTDASMGIDTTDHWCGFLHTNRLRPESGRSWDPEFATTWTGYMPQHAHVCQTILEHHTNPLRLWGSSRGFGDLTSNVLPCSCFHGAQFVNCIRIILYFLASALPATPSHPSRERLDQALAMRKESSLGITQRNA